MKDFLIIQRSTGIEYVSPTGARGGAIAFTGANNGVSISTVTPGTVVLGGNSGAAGAAALISNREIPMAGFQLLFSGVGNTTTGIPVFKTDAAIAPTTPDLLFQDSTGAETGRITFHSLDTFIGKGVGANVTSATTRNTGIGSSALALLQTAILNTAIGVGAMSSVVGPNTVGASVAIGDGALQFWTAGLGETAVGYQALQNIATGNNNTGLGIQAGGSTYLSSHDNTFVGANAGFNNLRGGGVVEINNTYIGSQNSVQQGTIGNNNVGVGFGFNVGLAVLVGNNNVFVGANQTTTLGTPSNSGMIGQGMDMQVSNTLIIGRSDQNVGIGQTVTAALLTSKLKVFGTLATGGAAPLTLGAGIWDMGNVVTAASVLNAAKYLEVSVGGVLVKVCIN